MRHYLSRAKAVLAHKLPCISTTPRIALNSSSPDVSWRFVPSYLTSERQCSFFVQEEHWQFSQQCLYLTNLVERGCCPILLKDNLV